MRNYRTLSEITEDYLRNHPEEVDNFVSVLFEAYAQNGDTAALLSSLRVVGRVKGISLIAENSGLSRKGVQKALSEDGNPKFESVNAIMHAMGYRLAPQKLQVF
ncbi:MAG TPA: addiction module antidote protein [Ktedonobacteraceae bacterium]|nr:addiction module antidote protein [Ktedonobacteraceae bacterium]